MTSVTCAYRFFRRAWLVVLPLWISACVVPVAPQFEDPPGNDPPYVVSSVPAAGAVLPASADGDATAITVALGDPNPQDFLVARWLIDYPPYDGSSRMASEIRLPRSGQVNREPITFAPSCLENQIVAGPVSHRVTLSVADRPFLPPDESALRLDLVAAQDFVVRTTWIVDLACP
jgi:hypothetical protein